jgi:hypothetical protein
LGSGFCAIDCNKARVLQLDCNGTPDFGTCVLNLQQVLGN